MQDFDNCNKLEDRVQQSRYTILSLLLLLMLMCAAVL